MAKPSNKKASTPKTTTKSGSSKTSNTVNKQGIAKEAVASKETTTVALNKTKASPTASHSASKNRPNKTQAVQKKGVADKVTEENLSSMKSQSVTQSTNSTTADRQDADKSVTNRGNGIAWLALLCGLGGLAAGGYAFYQSTLNQQNTGGKVVAMTAQLTDLSASQQQTTTSLSEVTERVNSVEAQVTDKLSGVERNFTQSSALIEKLQAQVMAVESKEPMTLLEQTEALEKQSATLQQQSIDTINQLSSQVGQRVSKWHQQELSSVLSSVARHLSWTGDTQRAASGLKMLDQEIKLLNSADYEGVSSALANDIVALEAVKSTDLTGTYEQLLALSEDVASLPFRQDSLLRTEKPKREVSTDSAVGEKESSTTGKLKSIGKSLLADLGSMVKIQNIDKTPAISLDTKAKFMLNESMRLNLKSAQLALLDKNDSLFQAELSAALSAATQYFDQQSEEVVSWLENLNGLASLRLSKPIPNISGSLEALAQVISQAGSLAAEGEQ